MTAREIAARAARQVASRQSQRLFPAPYGFPIAGGVSIIPTSQQDIEDADAWCGANCTARANRRSCRDGVVYEFETQRDGALFKLFHG